MLALITGPGPHILPVTPRERDNGPINEILKKGRTGEGPEWPLAPFFLYRFKRLRLSLQDKWGSWILFTTFHKIGDAFEYFYFKKKRADHAAEETNLSER